MNFDFLKGLNGLDAVYKPCTDAEELVKSKPYLSLIAARKSAELLAKFVYMAAHSSVLDGVTFADILADYQVKKFINDRTLEYLQRYVCFLDDMAFERSDNDDLCTHGFFKTTILLDGEVAYTDDNGASLQTVLFDRLPNAKTFEIDCYVYANMRSFYENPDPDAATDAIDEEDMWQGRGMADQLEALKRKEKFTYKASFRYPDDDSHTEFAYIRNGKSYDVEDICFVDILQQASKCKFYGDMITMYAAFDFKSHPEIVQQLRQAVLNYVSEDEHPYLEELWEENEEYDDCGYLLSGSCIPDADLSLSQQFADKVNQILAPIAEQCTIYMNYSVWSSKQEKPDSTMPALNHCFYDDDNFAVASFVWEDNKLQLVGRIH